MEISFNHKTQTGYRELPSLVRRVQVTAESVVPDTEEDVASVASIRPMLLLKSKDVGAHGVTVTGELSVSLLCITEGEQRVSCVRLKREFSMEYELDAAQSELQAQIGLSVGNAEARVLNPRKLAVTAEIVGELRCYQREELPVETEPPESARGLLHCRKQEIAFSLIDAVCEKTFALNEQFRFQEGKSEPTEILSQSVRFEPEDTQQIGSRAVVKGTVYVELCYVAKGESCPLTAEFSAPFSQLVDTGTEDCTGAAAAVELTGAYFDLVDTISGEKAVDAELHAVLQLAAHAEKQMALLTDAYSNRCPTLCSYRSVTVNRFSTPQRLRLSAEETVAISPDCEDVLSVLATLPPLIQSSAGLGGAVALDVIYRGTGGSLCAVHRTLPLSEEPIPADVRVCSARIAIRDIRPDGGDLRCRVTVEALLQSREQNQIQELASVSLDEEKPFDSQSFPSVTLVREPSEPLWELAKRWHSSVALIEAANADEAERVLLIPRE